MRITKFTVALPALFLAVALTSAPSDAQSLSSAQWYASGNIGTVHQLESEYNETAPGFASTGDLEFDTGLGINGAIGVTLGDFRVEGELSYRQSAIDSYTINNVTISGFPLGPLGTFDIDGSMSAFAFMANGWYDFNTGGPWKPFVGGGLGFANVDTEINSVSGFPVNISGDDTVMAYQFGAGVGYQITPTIVGTLGYRLFGTSAPEFTAFGVATQTEYLTHNIEVGARFFF